MTSKRDRRLINTVKPYTMVGDSRLKRLIWYTRDIEGFSLEGDIVECGTCNGGTAGILAKCSGNWRTLWLFDSFRGLPQPTCEDIGERSLSDKRKIGDIVRHSGDVIQPINYDVGKKDRVEELLYYHLSIPPLRVRIISGWFQDTFPMISEIIPDVALLHIDADWYESVHLSLEHFYDKVVRGGWIILDDYNCWPGAKKAVDEFLQVRGIKTELVHCGSQAAFRKNET